MANFADKNAGDVILNTDVNQLSDDTINATSGHQHSGSEDGHPTLLPVTIGAGASTTIDGRILLDKGGDLASGTTLTIGTDGNFFDVTGTTTMTAFSTLQAGTVIFLQFDGAVLLVHHATKLILEGAVNRTTEAKDIYQFISLGSGNWQEISRSLVTPSASHTIASHSDTSGTGAELNTLTDGSDSDSLHTHPIHPTEASKANVEAEATGVIFVPPDLLRNNPGIVKISGSQAAGGVLETGSYNCTSATKDSTGLYTITVADDFSNSDYTPWADPHELSGVSIVAMCHTLAVGTFKVATFSASAQADERNSFFAVGDQ